MRLKTKLVLAITALVLLISGLLSMVYVSQLLHASVQQSYETNRMVAGAEFGGPGKEDPFHPSTWPPPE